MNRLVFISVLFFIGFFLTQCSDDCGPYSYSGSTTTGIENINTKIQSFSSNNPSANIDSFGIYMTVDFLFASHIPEWSFISTAYACSPPPVPSNDATQYVDSILVFSEPDYNVSSDITSILSFERRVDLPDYNQFENRNILGNLGSGYFYLKEPPTQSDSFTFSFYYYKDGAIIDSSSTQKYFISE